MDKISNEALRVQEALIKKGIETPMITTTETESERHSKIKQHMHDVLTLLNLDLTNDSLSETPARLAKMYLNEIFSGLNYENFPKITTIENTMQVNEMVLVNDITLTSLCEHHFVTIDGKVSVAYYPKKLVIGLSKINRIVNFFARRPQVQERLTQQILLALQTILETEDVAVYAKAIHFCVKGRGIQDSNSYTVTSAFGGKYLTDKEIRKEFIALLGL